ncbi:MAG TPA: hypothetical protein VND65_18280 [Candidatus Binatia bacterium]|nr:hypothetical protein [Candidatus Binatia bacterium]
MRKLLRLLWAIPILLLFASGAFAQCPSQTPNVQFQVPNIGNTTTWGLCLNGDLATLDALLGGSAALPAGSATVAISQHTNWVTANTGPITITSIVNGYPGQTIQIFCGVADTFTSIAASSSINIASTWSCPSSTSITLTLLSGVWQEVARQGGASNPISACTSGGGMAYGNGTNTVACDANIVRNALGKVTITAGTTTTIPLTLLGNGSLGGRLLGGPSGQEVPVLVIAPRTSSDDCTTFLGGAAGLDFGICIYQSSASNYGAYISNNSASTPPPGLVLHDTNTSPSFTSYSDWFLDASSAAAPFSGSEYRLCGGSQNNCNVKIVLNEDGSMDWMSDSTRSNPGFVFLDSAGPTAAGEMFVTGEFQAGMMISESAFSARSGMLSEVTPSFANKIFLDPVNVASTYHWNWPANPPTVGLGFVSSILLGSPASPSALSWQTWNINGCNTGATGNLVGTGSLLATGRGCGYGIVNVPACLWTRYIVSHTVGSGNITYDFFEPSASTHFASQLVTGFASQILDIEQEVCQDNSSTNLYVETIYRDSAAGTNLIHYDTLSPYTLNNTTVNLNLEFNAANTDTIVVQRVFGSVIR